MYGKYGNVSDYECDYQCAGDSKTQCGGIWRNSVYEIGGNYSSRQFKTHTLRDFYSNFSDTFSKRQYLG